MAEAGAGDAGTKAQYMSRKDFVSAIVRDVLTSRKYSVEQNVELITNVVLTQVMVPEKQWLGDQRARQVDFSRARKTLESYLTRGLDKLPDAVITPERLTATVAALREEVEAQGVGCEHPWDFLCPAPTLQ